MPVYLYEDDRTGAVYEFFQGMNDLHEAYSPVDGYKLTRIYVNPQVSIDTAVDPYSSKDFIKATNKKGTIGDLMDRSAELSQKRADKDGVDVLKEKTYEKYSKERNGRKHPDVIKREAAKKASQLGIRLQ